MNLDEIEKARDIIFNSLIPHLEYVAKYNEGKFSFDKQKAAAFKKIFEVIHDNELLLSTAIYTKQLVFIKEIIQKIPIEKLVQRQNLWKLKIILESLTNNRSS